jgi:hypothetical protein
MPTRESTTPRATALDRARASIRQAGTDLVKADGCVDRPARYGALRPLNDAQKAVEAAMTDVVRHLREHAVPYRATWEDIGQALGISKQAARERFMRAGVQ